MRTEFLQWLNENSQRTYPFRENASLLDNSATQTIPDNFLLDLSMTINEAILPIRLSQIDVYADHLVLLFSFGTNPGVSGITIPAAGPAQRRLAFMAAASGGWPAYVNLVTGAGLAAILAWPVGSYTFPGAYLEEGAVLVDRLHGVVQLSDILQPGTPIAGAVSWAQGANLSIYFNEAANSITLAAAVGAGTGQASPSGPGGTCDGLIYEIAGAKPDARGNLNIVSAGNVNIDNEAVIHTVFIGLKCGGKLCQTPP